MTTMNNEDQADPSVHVPRLNIQPPEPVAHMYPSDLERFKSSETFATAFSVAVGNPDERSVPLYAADQMRAATAADTQSEQTAAASDVLAERRRQVEVKGWTPEHDDSHLPGEMALAACCYCAADDGDAPPAVWPWAVEWWKPKDRRRNMVKAAALLLAEIERLDRAAEKEQPK